MTGASATSSAQLRWYGEEIPLLGQTIVDVGANVGAVSELFWRESAGTSRLVSVEPVPANVALLEARRGAVDGPLDKWVVYEGAISTHDGEVFLETEPLPGGGFDAALRGGQGSGQGGGQRAGWVRARCTTLDGLVPDATVVKLDIEGHEHDVLEHALPRMKLVHTWALELHRVEGRPLQRTLAALVAHGYRLVAAGRARGDRDGDWIAAPIQADLGWDQIPIAQTRPDGTVFQMLHVLAFRR